MRTLLDNAKGNLNAAKKLIRDVDCDEVICNIAAYLLQQAVETTIKYQLEQNGVEYPKGHEIETLFQFAESNGIELGLTPYIVNHAEMFSMWETKTKYILDYSVNIKKIRGAIPEVEKSIEQTERAMSEPLCAAPAAGRTENSKGRERALNAGACINNYTPRIIHGID